MIESLQIHLGEEAIRIAGQAVMDFKRQNPALDVVPGLCKPGVNLMAKRILDGMLPEVIKRAPYNSCAGFS